MSRRTARDKGKFTSQENEMRYGDYTVKRPFCFERGFQIGSGDNIGLPSSVTEVLARRNWVQFASHPPTAHKKWVKEFYANFPNTEEENWVIVRKKAVGFDAGIINSAYGLENEEDAYADYLSSLTPEEWGRILERVCEPGTQWKCSTKGALTVNKTSLKDEIKVWYHFVITRLMPSTHGQTINGERIALLDTIISTRPLNVGRIIEQQIRHCATKRKGCLLFPALITTLCDASRVPNREGEAKIQVGGVLTPYAISRIVRNVSEHETQEVHQEATAPPEYPRPSGPIFQQQQRLVRRLNRMEENQRVFEQQQQQVWQFQQQRHDIYQSELQRQAGHNINFPEFPSGIFEDTGHTQSEEEEYTNEEEDQGLNQGTSSRAAPPSPANEDSDSSDEVYIDESRTVEGDPYLVRKTAQAAAVAKRRSGLRSASRYM